MNRILSKQRGLVALAIAGGIGLLLAAGTPVQAAPPPHNPGVLPPGSHPYGKSYSQSANRWWQWVDAIPMSHNPMIDPDGGDCAVGQSGPVWFIAGSTHPDDPVERYCTVPTGKGIFFPVANFQEDQREAVVDYANFAACAGDPFCDEAYSLLSPDPTNPAAMMQFLTFVTDAFVDPNAKFATIDEQEVQDIASYRSPSGPAGYTINLPNTPWDPYDNYHTIFGYHIPGPDTYLGVQDGYYLMLAPLSKGEHTVSFGEDPGWIVTYHLTVR